jgi:hypothetical protein
MSGIDILCDKKPSKLLGPIVYAVTSELQQILFKHIGIKHPKWVSCIFDRHSFELHTKRFEFKRTGDERIYIEVFDGKIIINHTIWDAIKSKSGSAWTGTWAPISLHRIPLADPKALDKAEEIIAALADN